MLHLPFVPTAGLVPLFGHFFRITRLILVSPTSKRAAQPRRLLGHHGNTARLSLFSVTDVGAELISQTMVARRLPIG